jgi:hypothetical protein
MTQNVVAVIGAVAVGLVSVWPGGPKTKLTIEMTGGFAYIPESSNVVNVAYLEDVDLQEGGASVCHVDQIGTEFRVLRGSISSYTGTPPPASKEFDVNGAKIRFPALRDRRLKFKRTGWKPDPVLPQKPGVPTNDPKKWTDVRFVPGIKERHKTNYALDPNWPDLVNGYMVLRGGNLTSTLPTDPMMVNKQLRFKVNGSDLFDVSITDKLIYTVDVPGTNVVVQFTDSALGYGSVTIQPSSAKDGVRLSLRGLHAMGTAPHVMNDQELRDHCAFYSLLKDPSLMTPVPSNQWLRPHFIGSAVSGAAGGQPSPGFFCPGDWM